MTVGYSEALGGSDHHGKGLPCPVRNVDNCPEFVLPCGGGYFAGRAPAEESLVEIGCTGWPANCNPEGDLGLTGAVPTA